MSWKISPIDTDLGDYSLIWDNLSSELFHGHLYFDSRLVNALLRYFGSGKEHLCIHFAEKGSIDGMVILSRRRFGMWTLFVPPQAQIAPVLLKHSRDLKTLFKSLPGFVAVIEFVNQDTNYRTPGLEEEELSLVREHHATTINVEIAGDFSTYWDQRSKNLRKNIKRYFNRARKSGKELRLRCYVCENDIKAALTRYGELETKGWKGKKGTAVSIDNRQGRFYLELLSQFSISNNVTIYELYFGEELVASRLCIQNNEMLIILKTAYDEERAELSPGRMLLYLILEREFKLGRVRSIEFYTNATEEQIAWSTNKRSIEHLVLYRNYIVMRLFALSKTLHKSLILTDKTRKSVGDDKINDEGSFNVLQFDEFESIPDEFRVLIQRSSPLRFETDFSWFQLLGEKGLSDEYESMLFGVEDSVTGEAKVFLPLMRKRSGRSLESLATFYTSFYKPLLSNDRSEKALAYLFRNLLYQKKGYTSLKLLPLPSDKKCYSITLEALKNSGWRPFEFFCFGNWYLLVNGRDYNEYFLSLPSKLRNTIERKNRKFFCKLNGSVRIVCGGSKLEEGIAEYEQVYKQSWKKEEPFPEFISSLISLYAENEELRLAIAYLDDQPVAAQIWIVRGSRAYIYKLAYDRQYKDLSIGTILTNHMMKQVIENEKVEQVDYLIGDEGYKSDWMSHRRERWGVVAYNPRTIGGKIRFMSEYLKQHYKTFIRGRGTFCIWKRGA